MKQEMTLKDFLNNFFTPNTINVLAFIAFFILTCFVCSISEEPGFDSNNPSYDQVRALSD